MLSERLTALIDRGLLVREVTRGYPARTRYRLSDRGRALRPLMIELYRTGERLAR